MKSANKGFTLIEILVALLILSIGVVGVTAAQLMSVKQNQEQLMRSKAQHIASDLVDRIRSNVDFIAEPVQSRELIRAQYNTAAVSVISPSSQGLVDCRAVSCTQAQMARFDMTSWACTLNKNPKTDTCANLGIQGQLNVDHEAQIFYIPGIGGNAEPITMLIEFSWSPLVNGSSSSDENFVDSATILRMEVVL